jgi:hypothetical protein
MDNRLEPSGAPSRSSRHRIAERFGENATLATRLSAAKSANRDAHLNGAAVRGQVKEPALIAAVHLLGSAPAIGARTSDSATSGGNEYAIWPDLDVVDQQTGRRQ